MMRMRVIYSREPGLDVATQMQVVSVCTASRIATTSAPP